MTPEEELEELKKMCENPEIIYFSQEDYDKLQEMIENPPPPSPKLIELLNRKAPWEQ
jgi:uncharacterized protein (DUF1778 family)